MTRPPRGDRAAALILAGGRGTRLWPAVRGDRPKSLLTLEGSRTLLGDTIARTVALIPRDRVFVLVAAAQRALFARALRGLIPARNLLVEPAGRGTAVAIAWGCELIGARLGESVVAVMPADHYVKPASEFRRTLAEAIRLAARRPAIVVIGVKPDRVEPGYGHIRLGAAVGINGGARVERFVEKPPHAAARRMTRSGRFLWNAGLFVMSTETLRDELRRHCPALGAAAVRLAAMAPKRRERAWTRLRFDAFDREVGEKSSRILAVRARFAWYDVGSWEGLWQAMRGRERNVLAGNVIALGARNVLARAGRRPVVLVEVEDLAVVDVGDAILVARLSRSQSVRRVPDELARRGGGKLT